METSYLTENRIKEYLNQKKRFDGRKPEDFREIFIEKGISKKAEGSARVRLGKTEVLVGVKMDVAEPYPDSKDEGNLMTTAELLPLSSDRFESGPPKIDAIELGRIVDRGIRESKFIDMKKLCIKEGEKVWSIFIDIYSINDDGNLLDAANMGAMIALADAKIPEYDEETGRVKYGEWTNKKIPLNKNIPLAFTLYKINNTFVVDPNREEEDTSESRITIAISNGDTVHALQKGEEKEFKIEELHSALDLAEKTYKNILPLIEKHLK